MGHAWGERPQLPLLGLTLVRASNKKLFQDCKFCLLLLPAALSAPHAPHLVFCRDRVSVSSSAHEVPNR